MADQAHIDVARRGSAAIAEWNLQNPYISLNLDGADLGVADLSGAELHGAILQHAILVFANLSGADLSGASLAFADARGANFSGANLSGAILSETNLSGCRLEAANLRKARLQDADLSDADLEGADFTEAVLYGVKFSEANLARAKLRGADLREATLVETNLQGADLTGCRVYGISAWNSNLEGATQSDLIVTPYDEPVVTVDQLEVAQFVYLLLHNEKIRDVIGTVGRKAVLILGRFKPERKVVLDALRAELRKYDLVPILFDFNIPAGRNVTDTVTLLARMARFIIADLTEPSSIPQELQAIVPDVKVPVRSIVQRGFDPGACTWTSPITPGSCAASINTPASMTSWPQFRRRSSSRLRPSAPNSPAFGRIA